MIRCSVHNIREFIDVNISVVAMNEETATKLCEEIAKLIGTQVSDTWKCDITHQTPAENLQETYFCTITYEVEARRIDKEIEETTKKDLDKLKGIAKFIQQWPPHSAPDAS